MKKGTQAERQGWPGGEGWAEGKGTDPGVPRPHSGPVLRGDTSTSIGDTGKERHGWAGLGMGGGRGRGSEG